MYVLRMRLCSDMMYSYVDCLSKRVLENSLNYHQHQQEVTSHSCGGIKYRTLSRLQEWSKMASWPAERREARSSAAGQLGERHPSKFASPHSLNWLGSYQVRQWPVVEGPVDNVKNGESARGKLTKDISLFGRKGARRTAPL